MSNLTRWDPFKAWGHVADDEWSASASNETDAASVPGEIVVSSLFAYSQLSRNWSRFSVTISHALGHPLHSGATTVK